MSDEQNKMHRDPRLMIALLLLILSAACGIVQAWILKLYLDAAASGNWAYFSETFSVEAPASGPDVFCLDHCAAELPFVAGWVGIGSFLLGIAVLFYCWLKPRPAPPQ